MLCLDGVENHEVMPIVYTQHSSVRPCTSAALLKAHCDELGQILTHSHQTFGPCRAMNLKSINRQSTKTPLWLRRPSPSAPKHSPILDEQSDQGEVQLLTGYLPVGLSASTTCEPDVSALGTVTWFLLIKRKYNAGPLQELSFTDPNWWTQLNTHPNEENRIHKQQLTSLSIYNVFYNQLFF